jgi:DNA-binding XRE family transcriptional regulator
MKQLHIILHTTQMTQVANLLEVQTKTIIDIDYDHLGPNMAIVPSIHALYM